MTDDTYDITDLPKNTEQTEEEAMAEYTTAMEDIYDKTLKDDLEDGDGTMNIPKTKIILAEYVAFLGEIANLYSTLTDGNIDSPFVPANQVLDKVEEAVALAVDSSIKTILNEIYDAYDIIKNTANGYSRSDQYDMLVEKLDEVYARGQK